MKFSAKLTLTAVIVSTLWGLVIGAFIYVTARAVQKEAIEINQETLAWQAIKRIDNVLARANNDIRMMAADNMLEDFLWQRKAGGGPIPERSTLHEEIEGRSYSTGPWQEVTIVDEEGSIVYSSTHNVIGKNIKEYSTSKTAYEISMNGRRSFYSDLLISDLTGKPTVIFSSPIGAKFGKSTVGVIIGEFAWQAVEQILRDVAPPTHFHLLNREGMKIGGGHTLGKEGILKENFSDNALVKRLASRQGRSTSGVITMTEEPVRVFGTYVLEPGYLNYKGNNWGLLMESPLSVALRPLRELTLMFVFYGFIGILAVSIVFYLLGKKLARPIENLTRIVTIFGEGNLDAIADEATNDEIGDLGKAFNQMAKSLKASMTSVGNLKKEIISRQKIEDDLQRVNQELVKTEKSLLNMLSDLQQSHEELQTSQDRFVMAQKMEALGTLTGGVAHDFNNILTVIIGYLGLAMMKMEKTDPVFSDLEEVRLAAVRASDLTRQLLLFSRHQPVQRASANLNEIISEILKMTARLVGENIVISTELEPGLKAVAVDTGNMSQVIMNLVVNSRDAMPNGGCITIKTMNVTVTGEDSKGVLDARPGEFVRFSVTDTGSGIDPAILSKIFDPFFTTKKEKGFGMGLSVVYGIIRQHEGWITVSSKPGHGSTFSIYLPVTTGKLIEQTREDFSLRNFQGKGERILVVEDETGVLSYAITALKGNGYAPQGVASAEAALEIFEKENGNFTLLFSDIVLPGKNGLELADLLRERKPGLPVLLASGYPSPQAPLSLILEKKCQFLQKPYTIIELLRTVKDVLKTA